MVDWGRIGLGIATGGMSELGGVRPALDAAAGNDYAKNLLFGGQATKGIDAQPQQYGLATHALRDIAKNAQGRTAPQMAGVQFGPAAQLSPDQMNQTRAGALGVAGNLGAIASGQRMGAGEMAVNRQVGQVQSAQASLARAAHGANAALAFRNAARNNADIGFQGAGMAAQAQMQDQQGANAQLGQLYSNLYGQDAGVAAQNAQLQQANQFQGANLAQQAQIENLRTQMQQRGMNDAQQLTAIGQMLGWDQARINAEIQKAQIAAGDKGILPGLIGAAGTAAMGYATGGASMAAPAAAQAAGGGSLSQQFPHGGSGLITSPGQY